MNFNNSPELLEDLTNININIYRIDIERNNFVFGFGCPPQIEKRMVFIKRTIPESLNPSENRLWQSFHFPGYSGNLVSDFNPASTAGHIEKFLPIIEKSPWIDLLMKTFSEAQSEKNINFAYLKLWSIMEMISRKRVQEDNTPIIYPDGSTIKYGDGSQVKTNTALGKVYYWLFQNNFQQSSVSFDTEGFEILFEGAVDTACDPNLRKNKEIIYLWDVVRGLYEIRNSTAHSGEFNPISAKSGNDRQKVAGKLYELPYNHLLSHIQGIVKLLINKEISDENKSLTKRSTGQ